ncbi:glycosyl transferase [Capsaspora owczarzaki ATCC 30864]|uniref:Glycosyl transferase n=1 Tax=Capsaspora owczarzaki (strain ATCC 30864) TaxID=595528 RepID=A0A0D2WPB9_CAPO3|nr:glycosyl transferase [Capsaspora owczarzaki ATCC 30864]KJE93165.1 glycosyl transferase [Capsaspora owczarzaki ATCC 30864]|eukprot:XP_004347818.1 glycosyl transferase [Capsaspora owczarzaki ATCC 30864]
MARLRKVELALVLVAILAYYCIVEDGSSSILQGGRAIARQAISILPPETAVSVRFWLHQAEQQAAASRAALFTLLWPSSSEALHAANEQLSKDVRLTLWWMGPAFSGGGYSSELISFAKSLSPFVRMRITQHGDAFSWSFVAGLPKNVSALLHTLAATASQPGESIVVCHSEPGAWNPSLYRTSPCPVLELEEVSRREEVVGPKPSYPNDVARVHAEGRMRSAYTIGRTMFEADRIVPEWVRRCNAMDEVWVPTGFHVEAFAASGVHPDKIVKIPEAVDVEFFDPSKHLPMALPAGQLAVGQPIDTATATAADHFAFLSVFKWEPRKAWDVLIKAYLLEFASSAHRDKVALYLLTNPFHGDGNFELQIRQLITQTGDAELAQAPLDQLPPIYILDQHVPEEQLPSLYKAVNCVVIPSRGEGWGRPHVEAMAMGLPLIATNWSGPTEYLNSNNGYPLAIDGLTVIESGAYRGLKWAQPSLSHLRSLMRHVFVERNGDALRKGSQARRDMIAHYRPERVAQVVLARLLHIQRLVDDRKAKQQEQQQHQQQPADALVP